MERLKAVLQNRQDNYMLPFFWQHGEDEAVLRTYMKAIYDANIREVCVESRPHPDFVGEKWWADMDVILDEAKMRGMRVWILDDSHFPTGYANGAMEHAPKELRHRYLTCRTLEMAGPVCSAEFGLKDYMKPAPLPPWMPQKPQPEDDFADDELLKVLACEILEGEEFGAPIDLTDRIADGRVVFDLPDGYYRIFVVYLTRNAGGRNDYINFLDRDSCRILIDTVYEPHYAHYSEYFGNVIAGFFSDEPPIGNVDGYTPVGPIGVSGQDLPWSAAAMDLLTEQFGSEGWKVLTPYLWGDAKDKVQQAKVRNAYMEMATRLIAECFSAQNGAWCSEHGVEYIGHQLEDCDMNTNLGASMGHFFRGLSGQHMAGVDNIGGQVTINGQNVPRHERPACRDEAGFYHYMIGKLGASHAAIDPKKRGRCLCENFGAYGWQSGPKEQKFMLDHFMVRGVNRYVPHAFSPAPFPDPDCPPHFYAHGENPTYRAFGELMAYGNRVCHLIDGGSPRPDVALLYNAESVWAGGSASNIPACRHLAQAQVDFHILPADVFDAAGEYPMQFDGKTLRVNGIGYGALVISGGAFVDAHTALFLMDAMETDFKVIFTDRRPKGIVGASEAENAAFARMAEKLPVVAAEQIGTYIREEGIVPLNVLAEPANPLLSAYRYALEGTDEYLILNEMAQERYEGELTVQAEGTPVRYYPWENRIARVSCTDMEDGRRKLSLSIEPLELCIIVFAPETAELDEILHENVNVWEPHMQKNVNVSELHVRNDANVCEPHVQKQFTVDVFTVGRVEAADYLAQLEKAGEQIHTKKAVVKAAQTEAVHAPYTGMQQKYPDFSGYYIYEANVELEPGAAYELELAQVSEAAEVFLNGTSLGTRVQAPYRFELPAALAEEEHVLRIEVATLPERKVRAMGVDLAAMSAHRPMSPTGILGTVTVTQR